MAGNELMEKHAESFMERSMKESQFLGVEYGYGSHP